MARKTVNTIRTTRARISTDSAGSNEEDLAGALSCTEREVDSEGK